MSPRRRRNGTPEERTVKVSGRANAIAVRASGHGYVAIVGRQGEVAREIGGSPQTTFSVAAGTYTVVSDGSIQEAGATTVEQPSPPDEAAWLVVSTDARDRHAVDGTPEIAADGSSFCTIAISKVGLDGRELTRRKDDDLVYLRSSAGSLTDAKGKRVRSVRLRSGKAAVRLVSDAEPRVATVEAFGERPLAGAELKVEFV